MASPADPRHGPLSTSPASRWTPRSAALDPEDQVRVIEYIVVGLAFLGILSTCFSFYWFLRMRRSFRHDLVMLLIQSDLVKAVWLLLFPLVDFARGPIASDSAFCQVSGFFLVVGIESSDVAILLITLHSAIYIFRPRSGLYPYRYFAYALYILFPLLIASLTFVGGHRYENVGYACYVENGENRRRLALSWIPRYIIFALVATIYIGFYIYVRSMTFSDRRKSAPRFYPQRLSGRTPSAAPPSPGAGGRRGSLPWTPSSAVTSPSLASRRRSSASANSLKIETAAAHPESVGQISPPGPQPTSWNWAGFTRPASSQHDPLLSSRYASTVPSPLASPLELPSRAYPTSRRGSVDDAPSLSSTRGRTLRSDRRQSLPSLLGEQYHYGTSGGRGSDATDPGAGRQQACLPSRAYSVIRRGLSRDSGDGRLPTTAAAAAGRNPHSVILSSHAMRDHIGMVRNRDKMCRQFGSLLVYPLVYAATWALPLASHAMGFGSGGSGDSGDGPLGSLRGDPFWLIAASAASLAAQGTIDSAVFALREKPWRHVRGGFWASLTRCRRLARRPSWRRARVAGRTREEMIVDGRIARERRREEAEAEAERAAGSRDRGSGPAARHWWDAAGSDEDEERDEGDEASERGSRGGEAARRGF